MAHPSGALIRNTRDWENASTLLNRGGGIEAATAGPLSSTAGRDCPAVDARTSLSVLFKGT
jgi:hypothetical protein